MLNKGINSKMANSFTSDYVCANCSAIQGQVRSPRYSVRCPVRDIYVEIYDTPCTHFKYNKVYRKYKITITLKTYKGIDDG